jgi:hypothetical protein
MLNDIASTVAVSLGYISPSTKLVYTDEVGANGEAIKGHYSTQTDTSYINDKNNNSTKELVTTTGHETQHAMDNQANIKVTNKADNEVYATNFGNVVADYTNYALSYTGNQSMATTNNHNGATTSNPSVFNNQLLNQNSSEFANVDKSLGEDDVLVPVNKRLSQAGDMGYNPKNPYVKYDFLSLNFKTPQEFESILKASGFKSIDEFRAAYDKDPTILKQYQFQNKVTNMTFESNRGRGTISGTEADWKEINLMTNESTKGHQVKITDATEDAVQKRLLTDGNGLKRTTINSHCGGPNASEGCVTNTTKTANSIANSNNIFLKEMYIKELKWNSQKSWIRGL